MSLAYVDCDLPKDLEEGVDSAGHRDWGCESTMKFSILRYH